MKRTIVKPIIKITSVNSFPSTGSGEIADDAPSTNNILKMLLPTILPKAISLSFLYAAVTEVISSGKDVPIATMVRPTNVSLIPSE